MRIVVDECCRRSLVDALNAAGYDTVFVRDAMKGTPDEAIAGCVAGASALLVTQDYDFGRLAVEGAIFPGGVLLMNATATPPDVLQTQALTMVREEDDALLGYLTIIGGGGVRRRKLAAAD